MTTLVKPSEVSVPVRDAGGDNSVPRDAKGRPRIQVTCDRCSGSGEVPSPKTGNLIKCSKCKGEGDVTRSYTRTTTYIDVLDDRSNLSAWQMRMVLVGLAADSRLLNDVTSIYDEQKECERQLRLLGTSSPDASKELSVAAKAAKDELNRRAQIAKEKAGAKDKAEKGTELHALSELVDVGAPLPSTISFEDVLDLDAYRRISEGFKIVHMEKLVVCDDLKVAGTPDRISTWNGSEPLVAPDGYVFEAGSDEQIITDLKTGTTEYGGLKMAMQLAIYANSALYDHKDGSRQFLGNINRKWGIIMNVPAGSGAGALHWADLELGWKAVEVARSVREARGYSRRALTAFV